MASNGFRYYWDYLGLDEKSYLVHYDFNVSGNSVIPSVSPSGSVFSGNLQNLPSNFWSPSGSGHFSGNARIAITHSTGLNSDYWTHFFIYQRDAVKGGYLFSAISGVSGYEIGVNDSNHLYFKYPVSGGQQFVETSTQIYADKNAVAVVKTNNVLTFYSYDFQNKTLNTDSVNLPSYSNNFSQAFVGGAQGYLDEYIYASQAINPTNLNALFSGFYSKYVTVAPIVATSGYSGITGYSYQFTGVTGVTGYAYNSTFSGVDAFGDNVYVNNTVALTGYLMSGLVQTPLIGYITVNITGQGSGTLIIDNTFASGFGNYNTPYNPFVASGLFETGLSFIYNNSNDFLQH